MYADTLTLEDRQNDLKTAVSSSPPYEQLLCPNKMLIAPAMIGAATIRLSKPPKKHGLGEKAADQPFRPQDQSYEWKGWKQALIIIYHYKHGLDRSCVLGDCPLGPFSLPLPYGLWACGLWFSEIIRLAVSSYLFLAAFGHAVYFVQKKDYSFRRVAAVMVQTNLLPATLAYVINTR